MKPCGQTGCYLCIEFGAPTGRCLTEGCAKGRAAPIVDHAPKRWLRAGFWRRLGAWWLNSRKSRAPARPLNVQIRKEGELEYVGVLPV